MKRNIFSRLIANKTLIFMIAPAVIYFFIFSYVPMLGIVLAFKEFRYDLGIFKSPWVGLDNFRFFFLAGDALRVTINTFSYNAVFIIVNNVLEIVAAILLAEAGKKLFRKVSQTFMLLPYFLSWVVIGAIAYNLFNFEHGAINTFLKWLNLNPLEFYVTPKYWKYILVTVSAWKSVGYGAIFYLAAITSVDRESYDAADIDGANLFQRIFHITLPAIRPTIIILVLLSIGGIFRGDFGLFYQLIGGNGLLYHSTDVIDTYAFRSLVVDNEIGMSAAIGFYQSILCFITILTANYLVRRIEKDHALF